MTALLHDHPKSTDSYVTHDEPRLVEFALAVGSPAISDDYLGRLARDRFCDLKIPRAVRQRTEQELAWLMGATPKPSTKREKILEREKVISRIRDDGRLNDLTAVSETNFSRLGLRFQWEPEIKGWPQLLDFGLALLIDSSRPYGNQLYRCTYSECRRFYLSLPTKKQGSRRTRYCCEEHYKEADKAKVSERVAKHRERQRKLQSQTKSRAKR
jgi:hypothetical protein